MKYNRLGTSDIEVSEFTLGCWPFAGGNVRSEEHTSELQSLVNLVCRLLLEKKNQTLEPLCRMQPKTDTKSLAGRTDSGDAPLNRTCSR